MEIFRPTAGQLLDLPSLPLNHLEIESDESGGAAIQALALMCCTIVLVVHLDLNFMSAESKDKAKPDLCGVYTRQ